MRRALPKGPRPRPKRRAARGDPAGRVERDGRIAGYTTGVAFFGHSVGESNEELKALIGSATAFGGFIELSVRDRVDGAESERVGYVEGWYVAPELRGQGVGRRLIEAAERWTAAQGLTELGSDVEWDNEGSLRAHAALGFEETFRLVHFLKRVAPE